MSEFQTSLVLIGAVVIVGVLVYNKWQERQATRAADELFKSSHPDVLIGDPERSDPHSSEPHYKAKRDSEVAVRHQAPVADVSAALDNPTTPDPRVDYVIELSAQEPLPTALVLESWSGLDSRFSRQAALAGLNDGIWGELPHGGMCERLRAALQMVSRKGVLGESELLEFRSEVETLASKLGASASAPEMREALEAARELDAVCAEADIQVAFHVVAQNGAGFAGTKLRAASEASGLVLDRDGRFGMSDERGQTLFVLSDRSGVPFSTSTMKEVMPAALTLSMDVPRAPDTQGTFDAMLRFGRRLASLMDGELVDDNGQRLDDRSVAAISAQLAVVRRLLDAQGIAPGSALSLRLFS